MIVNTDPFKRFIEIWLYTMFILIFLIVAVGGLTRLTDSGLSITEWELFKGVLPPLSDDKWIFYFDEYKKIPEYTEINYNMTLSEFKVIYYWEYGHRILARLIGLFSIVPLIYLFLKYKNERKNIYKYFLIFILICFQGFLGWFMVKSGLVNNTDVSHYRLALHLSVALLIISLVYWFLISNLNIKKFLFKIPNRVLNIFLILIVIQIIFGAFLAGLDGGLLYNTWPDMNGFVVPSDVSFKDLFSLDSTNNPSVIQFYHRKIAYVIFLFLIYFNYLFLKKGMDYKIFIILNLAILFQIALGIITLLSGVKISFASLHQLGSILVLTSVITLVYKNN
ncbi:COX15/CtaA family protein [Candidatus Pelagibacter sp. HIMB1321]|uniref:COX15/CtaA family protein n=1 Tax=Candidatus Pelagibacter sp. HIMB1321 TaxID=1388755 RepID=UPI000A0813FE|nr:COX15/CtaA family protein [Candidatus Pelagibacter sp. HIMB1321]SMF75561.1 cytochrome c oxidase assembly protein subunit 15 [Candidatus Pelagibacter sp. HIMB1321]